MFTNKSAAHSSQRTRISAVLHGVAALVTVMTILIIQCVPLVAAQGILPEQQRVYDNDIQWFDLKDKLIPNCDAAGGATTAGAGGGGANLDEQAKKIYDYLTGHDLIAAPPGVVDSLSGLAAAAFIGNWAQESGLDPTIGGGYLVQWGGGRLTGLQAFAASDPAHRAVTDITLQLDYVIKELTTLPDYTATLDAVKNGTDVAAVATIISDNYERPNEAKANKPNRIAQAQKYLAQFGGKPGSGVFAPGAVTTPGGGTPAAGAGVGTAGACPVTSANFTGAPGQTKTQGKGFTLIDNTDYSATPCAPGTTETQVYTHPTKGFRIRLCKVGTTAIVVASIISDRELAMVNAAAAAGVKLNGGGFRTYESQQALYIAHNCPKVCKPPTATPGLSQHERGLAVDYSSPGGGSITKGSAQYNWLAANAAKFGFYNLPSESWHWSASGN